MDQYEEAKAWLKSKKLPPDVQADAVFANAELNLDDIEVRIKIAFLDIQLLHVRVVPGLRLRL